MDNIFADFDYQTSWVKEKHKELRNITLNACPNYASLQTVHEKSIRKIEDKRKLFKDLEYRVQQLKEEWNKLEELQAKRSEFVNNVKEYFDNVDEFNLQLAKLNTQKSSKKNDKQEPFKNFETLHKNINLLADKINSNNDNTSTQEKVVRALRNFDDKGFSAVKHENMIVLDSNNPTWWKLRKNDGSEGFARAENLKVIEANKDSPFSKKILLNLFSKNSKSSEDIISLVLKRREEINRIYTKDLQQSSTEKGCEKQLELHKTGLLNKTRQFSPETPAEKVYLHIIQNLNAKNFTELLEDVQLWVDEKKSTYENNKKNQDVLSFYKTTVDFIEEIKKMNEIICKFEEKSKVMIFENPYSSDIIQKMVQKNRIEIYMLNDLGTTDLKFAESTLISIDKFKSVDKINLRL